MVSHKNKERKDVCFLCQFFYPEYVSSATLPYDTAVGLVKAGYSVSVLCGYPVEYCDVNDVPQKEKVQGIEIRRLKYMQLKRVNVIGRLINYFSFFLSVLFHLGIVFKHKVVIVYTNPPIIPLLAVLAKKVAKVKLVFVSYDVYPELMIKSGASSQDGIFVKVMNYVNKRVYKNADRVVCVCEDMKQYLAKNRDIEINKLVSIPNWFKDSKSVIDEQYNPFKAKYSGKMVVSYFGNMGTCQDIDTIIGAIRILKDRADIQFMFAGHGNKMLALKQIIANENLKNVDVYDFLKGKDYNDALSASHCAIVSLVSGLSGLCAPSKTIGYMMEGLPIIAIMEDSEITNDIMKNNAGIVVGNGDSQLLANKIIMLHEDVTMRKNMGINSRKVFLEKYEENNCIRKYIDLMRRII